MFMILYLPCAAIYFEISIFSSFFFFKQKTAYAISECDWSPDVCSSDPQPHNADLSPEHLEHALRCAQPLQSRYQPWRVSSSRCGNYLVQIFEYYWRRSGSRASRNQDQM